MECGDIIKFLDYSKDTNEKGVDMIKSILELAKKLIQNDKIPNKSKNKIIQRLVSLNQFTKNQKLKEMINVLENEIKILKMKKEKIEDEVKTKELSTNLLKELTGLKLTRKFIGFEEEENDYFEGQFKGKFHNIKVKDNKVTFDGKESLRYLDFKKFTN